MRAGVSHRSDCFWRYQGSGESRLENETAGPRLPVTGLFERQGAHELSGAHSQSKPENARRAGHRRRKFGGEITRMNWNIDMLSVRQTGMLPVLPGHNGEHPPWAHRPQPYAP